MTPKPISAHDFAIRSHLEMHGRNMDSDLHYDWYWDCLRYQERKEEALWAQNKVK